MPKFINNLFKNYSIVTIRVTLLATLSMILFSNIYVVKYTLTGDCFNAILNTVLMLLLIKVNKEVQ